MVSIAITNSIAIIDEIQNTNVKEMKTMCGRIGRGSKMILMGDQRQCDLVKSSHSGLMALSKFKHKAFASIELENNHRDPIVESLISYFDTIES